MNYKILKYNKSFFLILLFALIIILGCDSIKFIFCGNNVCDPGEEETCPEDCKEDSIKPKVINDVLSEGQSMIYELNGKEYEIKVLIISDMISPNGVKLNIEGKLIPLLKTGDVYAIDDKTKIKIKDIMINNVGNSVGDSIGDFVEFILDNETHSLLEEGESKIYNINEKNYYVKVLTIGDIIDPDSIVKFALNGKLVNSLKVGKNLFVDGLKLEVNEIIPNKANDSIADLVEFTLNDEKKDILEEGENRTYNIDGKDYNIQVVSIGDSGNIDPSVKLTVDDIITDTLYAGSKIILEDGTVLKIEEIIVNEFEEEKGNLIEISLNNEFAGIINNEHKPEHLHTNKEKNYKVGVASFNRGKEKKLTEKIPSVKFIINNKVSERLYKGQDSVLEDSCAIKVEILTPPLKETETDKVSFSFSCP